MGEGELRKKGIWVRLSKGRNIGHITLFAKIIQPHYNIQPYPHPKVQAGNRNVLRWIIWRIMLSGRSKFWLRPYIFKFSLFFSVFLCYFVNTWFIYLSQAAERTLPNGLTMILTAAKVERISEISKFTLHFLIRSTYLYIILASWHDRINTFRAICLCNFKLKSLRFCIYIYIY